MTNIKVEMLSIDDFNHICRTCSSQIDLKPLFDNIEILSMLESFTQMQFSRSDELPDKICANCVAKIYECFHFINNCKIIDERLRKCLHDRIEHLDIRTEQLHSSIEIKDEEPVIEMQEIEIETPIVKLVDEFEKPNIKEININQSEYEILQWGASSDSSESRNFLVGKCNAPNEQDLIEQQALRRIQAAERIQRLRAKNMEDINKLTQIRNKMLRTEDVEHRTRAKLTLPHQDHNYILRRNLEAPERVALRRALQREQMRKYRNKLTAEETTQHRILSTDRMRKFRTKLTPEDQAKFNQQKTRSVLIESFAPKLKIPLRLSEMAETLLHPRKSSNTTQQQQQQQTNEIFPRFSLRPTKIPQVKKQCFEVRTNENQVTKLRTWKRQKDTTDEVTLRLAKTALQMKRIHTLMMEPGQVAEETALQRAKKAGQLRQYRPMLRKNKTIPVPTVQTVQTSK